MLELVSAGLVGTLLHCGPLQSTGSCSTETGVSSPTGSDWALSRVTALTANTLGASSLAMAATEGASYSIHSAYGVQPKEQTHSFLLTQTARQMSILSVSPCEKCNAPPVCLCTLRNPTDSEHQFIAVSHFIWMLFDVQEQPAWKLGKKMESF